MTDISGYTYAVQAEDLSWDLTEPHQRMLDQVTLDVSLFTAAQHYPNGYIPSGTVIGIKTTGGKGAPYLDAASDGTQTAVGYLAASVQVLQPNGTAKTLIGAGILVGGKVRTSRLPFTSGTAAAGGYIDANGKADLKLIYNSLV